MFPPFHPRDVAFHGMAIEPLPDDLRVYGPWRTSDGPEHLPPITPLSHPSRTTTATSLPVALAPADMVNIEIPSDLDNWSDERFTDIRERMLTYVQTLPMQWAREVNHRFQRQRGPPEPDPQLRKGPSSTNAINRGPRKRRKLIEDDETGDKAATQKGETQELPVRRTPRNKLLTSKPGHCALGIEALAVPLQGVCLTRSLGAVETGAIPGPRERDQACTEGRGVIMEDPHEEEETDKERWGRLMKREDGVWECMGCGGRRFFNRSTLWRHCKSSLVHRKKRDTQKCPHCEKRYTRWSGVKRHMMEKH